MKAFSYHPFYCEENIWHLARDPSIFSTEKYVVFISNPDLACTMWHMKAAVAKGLPVIWDYHVILIAKTLDWQIFDLDTDLGCPVSPGLYLRESFRAEWPASSEPHFRVIEASQFLKYFSSDRKHMIYEGYSAPYEPPPWPSIYNGQSSNLWKFVDMVNPFIGRVLDLPQFRSLLMGEEQVMVREASSGH